MPLAVLPLHASHPLKLMELIPVCSKAGLGSMSFPLTSSVNYSVLSLGNDVIYGNI